MLSPCKSFLIAGTWMWDSQSAAAVVLSFNDYGENQ